MTDIWKGRAKRLDDIDLPKIGHQIGVGEDVIHAILDVESRGSGFDGQGRVAMLFEPHIFWRELGPGKKRDLAAGMGIAYPKWKPGAYPADSYPRMIAAMKIDATAALRSASWGLGQVMGFNHALAGYETPQDMVATFADDEERQLEAMIRFIRKAGLADELRRLDWTGFARGYNGPGFAKNDYHNRLARRYAHWQRIRDTPWSPSDAIAETAREDIAAPAVVFPRASPAPEPPKPVAPASEPPKGFWARFWSAFKGA
jgi:hypothetical protein